MVLVDQTVEALPAHYWPVAAPNCWLGRPEGKSEMRSLVVVVIDVLELAVAVMDEELDRVLQLAQLPGHVPSLLGHPDRVGMIGAVGVKDAAAMDLEKDQYVQRLE